MTGISAEHETCNHKKVIGSVHCKEISPKENFWLWEISFQWIWWKVIQVLVYQSYPKQATGCKAALLCGVRAAGLVMMRIKRSLRERCAIYLLKKLAVACVLNRKSTLSTLLKLALKFSFSPWISKVPWRLAQQHGSAWVCRDRLSTAEEWLKEVQGLFECRVFDSTYSISTLFAF